MRWLVPLGAVVAFALVGCHKPEPPPPPIKAPPPAPLAGARATVSPVAFDLVSVRDGAVLVWGQRPDSGGGVRMLRLGPLGQPLGRSEPVVDPTRGGAEAGPSNALSEDVLVSAFVANERLAIVWASRTPGGEVSLRVAEGPVSGAAFSAPRTLSRIRPVPGASARAYAYADPSVAGPSAVLYRGAESPCDDKKRCETYWWNAPGDPSLAQQPIPFKRPCEPAVAGLLRRGDRASALLCEIGDSGPTTTLVQVMPPLPAANDAAETTEPPKGRRGRRGKDARRAKHTKAPEPPPEATPPAPPAPPPPPPPSLPGCVADRLVRSGPAVFVVARCGEPAQREVFLLDTSGAQERFERLGPLTGESRCGDHQIEVAVGDDGSTKRWIRIAPGATRAAILLPPLLAPDGARAVWTGEALLVAAPLTDEIVMRRFGCVAGTLARTDV